MAKNVEKLLTFDELKIGDQLYFVAPNDLMKKRIGYIHDIIVTKLPRPTGLGSIKSFLITETEAVEHMDKIYYLDVLIDVPLSGGFAYEFVKAYSIVPSRGDHKQHQWADQGPDNTIEVANPDEISFHYDWANAILKKLGKTHLVYDHTKDESDSSDLGELNKLYELLYKLNDSLKSIKQLRWEI
jgi:hypothetical protein